MQKASNLKNTFISTGYDSFIQQSRFDLWMKVYKTLPESAKRWLAAQKALELGRGGIKIICEITGMSKTTILRGIKELKENNVNMDRIRNEGGGRKVVELSNKKVISAIEFCYRESGVREYS